MFQFIITFILSICQTYFFRFLHGLKSGHLVVKNAAGQTFSFGQPTESPLQVTITIRNEINFYWRVITRWDLGLGMQTKPE